MEGSQCILRGMCKVEIKVANEVRKEYCWRSILDHEAWIFILGRSNFDSLLAESSCFRY